jgi:sugar phosphate isomerase/epimerase
MIYVSSTCSGKSNLKEAVESLAQFGFRNIELSGGTRYYPGYLDDLKSLKEKYRLSYRLHNYFPPPEKSFVLNLASQNPLVLEQSRVMVKLAVDLSAEFNCKKFGMHAGFRIQPKVEELGQTIASKMISPYEESLEKFKNEFLNLAEYASLKGIELLLENNVFSAANQRSFDGVNPFFLTNSDEYFAMQKQFSFALLLDIAHLKVSCRSLGFDFLKELAVLLPQTDYIHISDNDGLHDGNHFFTPQSDFWEILKTHKLAGKTFTIEVYDGLESLRTCHDLLESLGA